MTTPSTGGAVGLPQPLPFPATTVGLQPLAGDVILYGFSITETTGVAAAQVELFDGNGGAGVSIGVWNLSPGQSVSDVFGPHGLQCRTGLWVQPLAGSVRGSLWAGDV